MIYLRRLDDSQMVVNAELIATVESTPDTLLTLLTGARLMVKDSVSDVVEKTIEYRRRVGLQRPQVMQGGEG